MSNIEQGGQLLTPREVSDRLKVSLSLVYQLCKELRLKHCRFGAAGKRGSIRIEESEVQRFREESDRNNANLAVPQGALKHLNLK